jgi:hypothetical protein
MDVPDLKKETCGFLLPPVKAPSATPAQMKSYHVWVVQQQLRAPEFGIAEHNASALQLRAHRTV